MKILPSSNAVGIAVIVFMAFAALAAIIERHGLNQTLHYAGILTATVVGIGLLARAIDAVFPNVHKADTHDDYMGY